MFTSNRRQFLCIAAGGAFGLGATGSLLRAGDHHGPLQASSRTSWALGSDVTITALHTHRSVAAAAIDEAFAELELIEEVMSIYRPHSQLCTLNRTGVLDRPHAYFVDVLQAAQKMSRKSGGAFDITVQPLWELFADAKKSGQLPADDHILAARANVDWRRVTIEPSRIRLRGGTAVTLNGVAQGFAADKATAALQQRGVRHALINTGEIGSLGTKANGRQWTIGIQHPRHKDAYISLAQLAGRCLATSGDYESTFSDDFRCHHLFDPRTGRSPSELSSVSVAAPTAMQADALSTAMFVLGLEDGMKLIRATAGADALVVCKTGHLASTRGFPLIEG